MMFLSLLERINANVSYACWCSKIEEPVFVVSIDGSRTKWRWDGTKISTLPLGPWPFLLLHDSKLLSFLSDRLNSMG
ncbi:hypothetical protein Bca4012_038967 [Brassica carinata]